MSAPRRVLSICADDFGLTLAISRGIVELAQRGRLTAVSCLTNVDQWRACAALLAELPAWVERGLHFNLTDGEPISPQLRRHAPHGLPLPRLIAAAHLGRLPLAAIACEWQAQWQRFVDTTGAAPRFVDGHQHVHHLPGVRDIVLAAVAAWPTAIAVRNTGSVIGSGSAMKRWLIECTGGAALQRQLQQAGIEHNQALLGVYGFRDPDYRRRMQRWLAAVPAEGGLLFCHPAAVDAGEARSVDAIGPARLREAAYLGGPAFEADLREADVTLGRAWQQRSSAG